MVKKKTRVVTLQIYLSPDEYEKAKKAKQETGLTWPEFLLKKC